ncbi:MAG TPA: hypothetical protein VNB49_02900, partial [Candidatus Dormibacteraeota bacterium]|nr:hypothetical protein [Candidatus Dormibacteraeota bacterium]
KRTRWTASTDSQHGTSEDQEPGAEVGAHWRGAALVWRQDIGYTNSQDMGYTMAKTWVTVMAKT